MPHRSHHTPKYRHYKPKNLAVVRIDGRDHYLGKYDSDESRERYDRLIAEWLSNGRTLPPHAETDSTSASSSSDSLSIAEVALAYWRFAQTYYVKNGEPTAHLHTVRAALHLLAMLEEGRVADVMRLLRKEIAIAKGVVPTADVERLDD